MAQQQSIGSEQRRAAKVTLREIFGYLPSSCVALLESGPDGEELMRLVVSEFGGNNITVPITLRPGHQLAKKLGYPNAQRVWKIWRGNGSAGQIKIYIPKMTMTRQKRQRLKLLRLLDAGSTVGEAARVLGVTERTIYSMRRRSRELGEKASMVQSCSAFLDYISDDR